MHIMYNHNIRNIISYITEQQLYFSLQAICNCKSYRSVPYYTFRQSSSLKNTPQSSSLNNIVPHRIVIAHCSLLGYCLLLIAYCLLLIATAYCSLLQATVCAQSLSGTPSLLTNYNHLHLMHCSTIKFYSLLSIFVIQCDQICHENRSRTLANRGGPVGGEDFSHLKFFSQVADFQSPFPGQKFFKSRVGWNRRFSKKCFAFLHLSNFQPPSPGQNFLKSRVNWNEIFQRKSLQLSHF